MIRTIRLTCRDPIIARDGRPFGAGQGIRMRSTDWPLPSVVAGSCRTALAKEAGLSFDPEVNAALLRVAVTGPFPIVAEKLHLPAPDDCVIEPMTSTLLAARPVEYREGEGCDLPHPGLRPVVLPDSVEGDFKPASGPAFWGPDLFERWQRDETEGLAPSGLARPEKETRQHVTIDPRTGAAEDGLLFSTTGLHLETLRRHGDDRPIPVQLAVRLEVPDDSPVAGAASTLDLWHALGGERRLAHWKSGPPGGWDAPSGIVEALGRCDRVRMTLASPAIFERGWLPGWLDAGLEGSPPGVPSVRLMLVGACLGRRRSISGWSLDVATRGPKPTRRMVPAGGVYFFRVVEGDASELGRRAWLRSACDAEQDRRDGFGLATWGVWRATDPSDRRPST